MRRNRITGFDTSAAMICRSVQGEYSLTKITGTPSLWQSFAVARSGRDKSATTAAAEDNRRAISSGSCGRTSRPVSLSPGKCSA
ncbi:hypothetical protein [Tabrizicola thermarum]|uniref:hypothetical protein n=1 Tax=Tabrizicola thermarum TaxID=2670345 RepID=UPI000FFB0713|nr:hypothetical protein [Tabrizicola thermarum]